LNNYLCLLDLAAMVHDFVRSSNQKLWLRVTKVCKQ